MAEKSFYLNKDFIVEHFDIKKHDVTEIVETMGKMAFTTRDLSRAA